MYPAAAPPLADIGCNCTNEELFMVLEKIMSGSNPPSNVITEVNPHIFAPSNLPGIWYLIHHKEDEKMELGFWKVKGEACKLFSNSVITGWRTTLEFYEGQGPQERKTDWVMQEYWITKKGLTENSKAKEARSLCKVFRDGGRDLDHEKQQKMANPHIARESDIHLTLSIVPKAHNGTSNGSTSKLEVDKDDDRGKLDLAGRPLNHLLENRPEDYFSRGDYLELLDLDNPALSSSSSDNSSCCTMSSDEYFDYLALLQDLESESNQGLLKKNEGCKFSISASLTPNEVVMLPASPESITSLDASKLSTEDILRTEMLVPGLANGHKDLDNKVLKHAVRHQKSDYRDEGPSSNSYDEGTSSKRHITSQDGEKKAAKGRMKKIRKKYLCFMPFYFLF